MDEKSCVHVAFPRFTANSISNEHDGELLCGKGGRAVSPLVVSAPTVPGPTRRQDRVGGCETQPLACFPHGCIGYPSKTLRNFIPHFPKTACLDSRFPDCWTSRHDMFEEIISSQEITANYTTVAQQA